MNSERLSNIGTLLASPPAARCMVCGRTAAEAGGRLLVAQQERGIALRPRKRPAVFANLRFRERLGANGPWLFGWGEPEFMTAEAFERARADFLAGRHPWFCQRCGKRCCRLCGAPENRPVCSDYLLAGGSVHCPSLGADTGCSNPECARYRSWGPGKENDDD